MRVGRTILIVMCFFLFAGGISKLSAMEEIDQVIDDFNLSGYGEDGSRSWEIFAKTAEIISNIVKLNNVIGTIYGQEKIVITGERGDFDRVSNKIHLEKNVVITTGTGMELTTDYLNWDNGSSIVTTDAEVKIRKDNMSIRGIGLEGDTTIKDVNFKRDVRLDIDSQKGKIMVVCDGPLNIDYPGNIAVFNKNVFVDDGESQLYADRMEVFFDVAASNNKTENSGSSFFSGKDANIKQIIAKGNVKIIQQGSPVFADEAVYSGIDRIVRLTGRPRVVVNKIPSVDKSKIE